MTRVTLRRATVTSNQAQNKSCKLQQVAECKHLGLEEHGIVCAAPARKEEWTRGRMPTSPTQELLVPIGRTTSLAFVGKHKEEAELYGDPKGKLRRANANVMGDLAACAWEESTEKSVEGQAGAELALRAGKGDGEGEGKGEGGGQRESWEAGGAKGRECQPVYSGSGGNCGDACCDSRSASCSSSSLSTAEAEGTLGLFWEAVRWRGGEECREAR
ncbi:hypothetical protein DFH09DRAFT_1098997 [Mycena vulgaris]|nr:hypothetical protein DFH09DRAFT_1098997 [Mycena vulgaris]